MSEAAKKASKKTKPKLSEEEYQKWFAKSFETATTDKYGQPKVPYDWEKDPEHRDKRNDPQPAKRSKTPRVHKERVLKVNRDDVLADLKKMSIPKVAAKYGISTTYAWRIKNNRFK